MRFFIPALAVTLAALCPSFVRGEQESKPAIPVYRFGPWPCGEFCSNPVVWSDDELTQAAKSHDIHNWFYRKEFRPVLSWSGALCARPTFDWIQDDDFPHKDQWLILVNVKAANTDRTFHHVALMAGNEILAEADADYGLVVFLMKGDPARAQDLAIKIALFDAEPFEWNCLRHPLKFFLPPDGVEIIIMSPAESTTSELPGFAGKSVTTSKDCPVHERFALDLVRRERTSFGNWMAWTEEKEFRTRPFSLKTCAKERLKPQTLAKSLWAPSSRRPGLVPDWKLLGPEQLPGSETMEIQPADWHKGTACDSLNPGLYDECRFLVSLDGQKPEVIVIRTYREPKLPESKDSETFQQWFGLFR